MHFLVGGSFSICLLEESSKVGTQEHNFDATEHPIVSSPGRIKASEEALSRASSQVKMRRTEAWAWSAAVHRTTEASLADGSSSCHRLFPLPSLVYVNKDYMGR